MLGEGGCIFVKLRSYSDLGKLGRKKFKGKKIEEEKKLGETFFSSCLELGKKRQGKI